MTDNNVISMPEPLNTIGKRIDAAFVRTLRGHQEWIEGTLELAQAFADARMRFPSDNDFGAWCGENSHDHVNSDDRAALIHMWENPSLARIVLEETERRSWQLIWRNEMQDRFRSATKPNVSEPAPEIVQNSVPEPMKTTPATSGKMTLSTEPKPTFRSKSSNLKDLPKVEHVLEYVLSHHARAALGNLPKTSQRAIWSLLLESIDNGCFGPPNGATIGPVKDGTISLRWVLPWLTAGQCNHLDLSVDLRTKDGRAKVRAFIFPVVIANREAVFADPSLLGRLANRARVERENTERQRTMMDKHVKAITKLPVEEQEVVAFGTPLWPPQGLRQYTYDELRHAIWFLTYLYGFAPKVEPMTVRHLIKFVTPMLRTRGWADAARDYLKAYESNPTGASKLPRGEINFGMHRRRAVD